LPKFFFSLHKTKGVSHCVALPFTLKSVLSQKKNYGNPNISPCKNLPKRNQNPSKYYNSVTNVKFQHKPKYQDRFGFMQNVNKFT
jgi:hypothetical protein